MPDKSDMNNKPDDINKPESPDKSAKIEADAKSLKAEKKKKIFKLIALVLALAVFIALTVWLTPKIMLLKDPKVRTQVRDKIHEFGTYGIGLMLGLQILQIVVAFIPGEPVELLMGYLYGTFGGLALCLAGIAGGTMLVFFLAKKLGRGFIERFSDPEKFKKLGFLRDPGKRDSMFFLLFLIPGTPKDILTYFAPLTGIGQLRFVLISCVARIPSVISSTYVGATLSDKNYLMSAIVFGATAIIGLAGIFINNRIIEKRNRPGGNNTDNGNKGDSGDNK